MPAPRGHQPAEPAPAHVTLVPLAVIVACAVGGAALLWSVRDQLPAPIAIHWDAAGHADGFSTLTEVIKGGLLFTAVMPLALLGLGLAMRQTRVLGPVSGGLAAFISVLMFGGAFAQRGIADPSSAGIDRTLWLAYAAGILVGVSLWLVTRRRTRPAADPGLSLPPGAPVLGTSATAKVAWTGTLRRPVNTLVPLGLGGVLVLGSVALGVVTGALALWLPTAGIFAAVFGFLYATMAARVTVDARGVRARGLGVVPLATIPLSAIENATIKRVDPLGDFGGWGLRGGFDGSWGIVTAAGDALRLERAGDSPYYLTVTDAVAAAAAVNTLVGRHSGVTEDKSTQ